MVDRVRSFNVDLTPRRHHGYSVLLFIFGTLFPPLAVAARFGIGGDFWLNVVLTIAGYIPGHVHNFYIQNIRNNKTHRRTPKWVQRYGLVDTSEIKRKERRSQWANRYNDRLPRSTLDGQPYAEGEVGGSSIDLSDESAPNRGGARTNANGGLWDPSEERYYGEGQHGQSSASVNTAGSGGRWRYPANFEDAEMTAGKKGAKRGKKEKKDRWARTEDAYAAHDETSSKRKKSKRSSKKKSAGLDVDAASQRSGSTTEFPEDAEGGLYGDRQPTAGGGESEAARRTNADDIFNHEL
ncbi:uncharacterized protein BXZ73DRAFT_95443 [Epithele typhae]|uniref:uncharacterized protein n=1 Tax=Epithele typhae TaxID=378194 RepID=UPI00200736DB|nr:uncharacterized protein BXZ73DRAFT_95443 [Epithele typhae]KAH9945922.1 hypothetical protein BXZ73DRAFT_95443 [Epithele typhae]